MSPLIPACLVGRWVTGRRVTDKGVGFDGRHFDVLHAPFAANAIEDNEARPRVNKPLGEWNSVEIVSANGQVKSSLNGVLVSTVSEHEYTAGHIGFQAEGSEIAWRNIRIKEN